MCTQNCESEEEVGIIFTGDSINTFYYAYCNTEGKRIGNATNQRIVAENTARYHADKTGHETSIESDKNKSAVALMALPCSGNGCAYILSQVRVGPSIRLRNTHHEKVIQVKVFWATIMGTSWNTYEVFPEDEEIFQGPGEPYIGVSRIEARII